MYKLSHMQIGYFDYPTPANEPVLSYAPGTPEKLAIHIVNTTLKVEKKNRK